MDVCVEIKPMCAFDSQRGSIETHSYEAHSGREAH
jgi:hypothetical protein